MERVPWPSKGLSPQLCVTQATAELKVGMSFAVSRISGILGIHSFKGEFERKLAVQPVLQKAM